ncbi:CRISPR system precrRNA processing endoribonuclease RAMP protein Cas6 [Bacillus sp. HMF5848]|uniref:CRISPR system precrRNA processing endoribonuclease RAMP protein Cas6 n=1 Tax=Bacillus sp. HMF5848 TaxID=2495421 RepID=UPI000F77B9B5|nr:CRISPR system precrRNA processing endoribonuclease RAMP protein Cas6 [Bacillus sp. HMF5848]RSK26560.1 CRISPR system precrRNA processing endoribonuclease RAMP protein Cas6 [Bacillus sp. HMF5848]
MIELQTLELVFQLEAQASGNMPYNSGSVFRGVIGNELHRKSCIFPNNSCENCQYIKECSYGSLFQPVSDVFAPKYMKTMKYLTPPFLIEPPLFLHGRWKKGEEKQITIKLFGQLTKKQIFDIIDSLFTMGKLGVGPDRITFNVVQAYKILSDSIHDSLLDQGQIIITKLIMENRSWATHEEVSEPLLITLDSPLRIQSKGKIQRTLNEPLFIQSVIRRVRFLIDLYSVNDNFNEDIISRDNLNELQFVKQDFKWENFRRYSSRQEEEVDLGGVVGMFQITGIPTSFIPWVCCGSYAHIGKQTVFGLGKYSVWSSLN